VWRGGKENEREERENWRWRATRENIGVKKKGWGEKGRIPPLIGLLLRKSQIHHPLALPLR